jgi:hypothetical protein
MKKEHIIIAILFLIVLGTRLFFAFQTPYFSDDEAYYNIRQVVYIKQNLIPMIVDELSYGGKILYLPPLFFYILAALSFAFKTEFVGKFFPNLFASSIVVVAYLIAGQFTKNKRAIYLTALMAGFMPIFFSKTLNSISIYSFSIPIMFFTIYCMMKITKGNKNYIAFFIPSLLMLRITTPTVIFLIFALLVYLLFIFVEKLKRGKVETELILFSTFLIIWTLFVGFKNAFLNHGLAILWHNIPAEIMMDYFANTNLLLVIYLIGIIPFVFGLYSVYKYIFKEKDKCAYLLISFALVITFFMWLRLIELNLALILIGFVLVLLFPIAYTRLEKLIKSSRVRNICFTLTLAMVILSSLIPSLTLASSEIKNAYSQDEIKAMLWLRQNTDTSHTILASLDEGHLISTIGRRKNILDSNFMFVNGIDQRLQDVRSIYTTASQTQAITLLNKYDIHYIIFSKRAKGAYGIQKLQYLDDKCFRKTFENKEVQIYKSLCIIEQK